MPFCMHAKYRKSWRTDRSAILGMGGIQKSVTWKATRMGTLAALCMGVADSGMAASTRERGLVGRYRSARGSAICSANINQLWPSVCANNIPTFLKHQRTCRRPGSSITAQRHVCDRELVAARKVRDPNPWLRQGQHGLGAPAAQAWHRPMRGAGPSGIQGTLSLNRKGQHGPGTPSAGARQRRWSLV